jgi:hypothetical protein
MLDGANSTTCRINGHTYVDGIEDSRKKSRAWDQFEESLLSPLRTDCRLSTKLTRREGRGNLGIGKEYSQGRPAHCGDDRVALYDMFPRIRQPVLRGACRRPGR